MKTSDTLVLIASSRSHGHTRKIVDYFVSVNRTVIIDINGLKIGFYDYDHKNESDDFMGLIPTILEYPTIIFATPIYWYSMSAQMKTFFDRLSNLLVGRYKPLGRQLRGKRMAVISCGSDNELFEGFQMPFEQSSKYLGMHYIGHVHTWIEPDGTISDETKERIEQFSKQV